VTRVSRTRCSVLDAAPQSRDHCLRLAAMGPGPAAHRKSGALRSIRGTSPPPHVRCAPSPRSSRGEGWGKGPLQRTPKQMSARRFPLTRIASPMRSDLSPQGRLCTLVSRMCDVCKGRSDSIGAGAPAGNLEITQAMIEAGVGEICTYNLDFETKEEAVSRIFEAMLLASRDC